MTQRITLDPKNPVQGGKVTICYDFTGLEITTVDLKIEFFPSPGTTTVVVTPANRCVTIDVPDNALSILVQDQSGNSPDKSAAVIPA